MDIDRRLVYGVDFSFVRKTHRTRNYTSKEKSPAGSEARVTIVMKLRIFRGGNKFHRREVKVFFLEVGGMAIDIDVRRFGATLILAGQQQTLSNCRFSAGWSRDY